MKTNVIRMFLALGAACVSGTALHAQSYDLSADIPFAFQVSGKALPAGKYVVSERGVAGVPTLQSRTTGHSILVGGAYRSLDPVHPGRLVFHCYGTNGCFLAEIWPVSGAGSAVAPSKAEKEIRATGHAREMATRFVDLHRAD